MERAAGAFTIGQPVLRLENLKLLTGRCRYVDHAKARDKMDRAVLRSPYGHACIRSIDTRAAKQMDGVLAVLTVDDVREMVWQAIRQATRLAA